MVEMILNILCDFANHIETIANLAIVITVVKYFYNRRKITIALSCGEVKLRACDLTCQNLTNMISAKYFNGGNIPAEVRAEIIKTTTPKWQ